MELRFQFGDALVSMTASAADGGWSVRLPNGSEGVIRVSRLDSGLLDIEIANRRFQVPFCIDGKDIHISFNGREYTFSTTWGERPTRNKALSGLLSAPMVGVVADLFVKEGDAVNAYQPLATLEAMKVLVTLESPFDGAVARTHVQRGDRVEHGAPVIEITPLE